MPQVAGVSIKCLIRDRQINGCVNIATDLLIYEWDVFRGTGHGAMISPVLRFPFPELPFLSRNRCSHLLPKTGSQESM